MRKNLLAAIVLLVLYIPSVWAAAGYPVRGRVIDRLSREPVAYAAVTITGQPGKGAMTDSLGRFEILQVKPGIYSVVHRLPNGRDPRIPGVGPDAFHRNRDGGGAGASE